MKAKTNPRERAFWAVLLALVLAHLAAFILLAYPAMPQTVPVHWGIDGRPDGWGGKAETLAMAALPLLVMLVMFAAPRLDPKGRNYGRFRGVYLGATAAIALFTAAVSWLAPLAALGIVPDGGAPMATAVLGAVSVLMIALGNYMPRIKPNYTFGIRLPWTLASEENWRATHRFAGPVYMAAGAVMAAGAALSAAAPAAGVALFTAAVLGATAAVGVYSFAMWRRQTR